MGNTFTTMLIYRSVMPHTFIIISIYRSILARTRSVTQQKTPARQRSRYKLSTTLSISPFCS